MVSPADSTDWGLVIKWILWNALPVVQHAIQSDDLCQSAQQLHELLHQTPAPSPIPCRVAELLSGRKVVVYGCGDGLVTFSVFVLDKYGIRPEVLLDRKFAAPCEMSGVPAMSPSDYHPDPEILAGAVAVITSGKPGLQRDIAASLRELGFRNIILASDIYEYHLSHAPAGFEQLGQAYFREHEQPILQAWDLLGDEKSRSVFFEVLRTHVERSPVAIPRDPLERQYFPEACDVPLSKGVSRTINCGAYNGDTIRQLHAIHGRIEALVCFEPDPDSFAALNNYLLSQAGQLAGRVMAFPCGVFNTEALLRFSGGNRINSSIGTGGATTIQCVALDHVIPDFCPTFINMDVEGAEPEAIRGAENLIHRNQPDLAICVYHQPRHLWEICLQLHALVPDYRFYLRNYTGFPAETVLYATTRGAARS
jgi:FkbM family methyltransferase